MARVAADAQRELASTATLASERFSLQLDALGAGGGIAKAALDESWISLRAMHEQLITFQALWNSLAQRVYEESRAVE